jgi:Bacterial PH domain
MIRHRVREAEPRADLDGALDRAGKPADKVDVPADLPPRDGKEQDVMTLRASLFRSNPAAYVGLWIVMLGGAYIAALALRRATGSLMWLPGVLLLAAGVVPMVVWKLRTMHSWVRITNKRIIDSDGFFRKTTSEILHRDIRNVRVEQTLLQRITRTGTLSIFTSSDEVPEVHMEHVPRPDRVRTVIDGYRDM